MRWKFFVSEFRFVEGFGGSLCDRANRHKNSWASRKTNVLFSVGDGSFYLPSFIVSFAGLTIFLLLVGFQRRAGADEASGRRESCKITITILIKNRFNNMTIRKILFHRSTRWPFNCSNAERARCLVQFPPTLRATSSPSKSSRAAASHPYVFDTIELAIRRQVFMEQESSRNTRWCSRSLPFYFSERFAYFMTYGKFAWPDFQIHTVSQR